MVTAELAANNIDTPHLDAKVLIADILQVQSSAIYGGSDRSLNKNQLQTLADYIKRRIENKEPVSRIIGKREFWSIEFDLSEGTLDPRPDSETLVEVALQHVQDKKSPLKILDLGTGSGCLLISLLSELGNAKGIGIDISERAIATANKNAEINQITDRCKFIQASWSDESFLDIFDKEEFDLIISNPPYIKTDVINELADEVKLYDPIAALNGGQDGLEAYRILFPLASILLKEGGRAVLEIGFDQKNEIENIVKSLSDQDIIGFFKDLNGIYRCICTQKSFCAKK